jgi:hypothetical protein
MGAETQVGLKRNLWVTFFVVAIFTIIGIAHLLLSRVEYHNNAPDGLASDTVDHRRTDMTFTQGAHSLLRKIRLAL